MLHGHVGFQESLSSRDILMPALPSRHQSHLRISPMWQMAIEDHDKEISEHSQDPQTPPTPPKKEPAASHNSKATKTGSGASASRASRSKASSQSPQVPCGSSGSEEEEVQTAGPLLDWVFGVVPNCSEMPSLPGESHLLCNCHVTYQLQLQSVCTC